MLDFNKRIAFGAKKGGNLCSWDGSRDDGSKADTGWYVAILEVSNGNGRADRVCWFLFTNQKTPFLAGRLSSAKMQGPPKQR